MGAFSQVKKTAMIGKVRQYEEPGEQMLGGPYLMAPAHLHIVELPGTRLDKICWHRDFVGLQTWVVEVFCTLSETKTNCIGCLFTHSNSPPVPSLTSFPLFNSSVQPLGPSVCRSDAVETRWLSLSMAWDNERWLARFLPGVGTMKENPLGNRTMTQILVYLRIEDTWRL